MNGAFLWKPEYSLGIKIIDEQHQQFIITINDLYQAIQARKTTEALADILTRLIEYSAYHFGTEEKYFAEFHYAETQIHVAAHDTFRRKMADLQSQASQNELAISFELIDYLEDWLVEHLSTMDRRYVECFHEHGLNGNTKNEL
ncbi:MAG: bacteriohemerythrin [Patescibacteria group bacterium]